MSRIKKMTCMWVMAAVLLTGAQWQPVKSYADIPHIEGGVSGDVTLKTGVYDYQEMTFISGSAVAMTGTVTVPAVPTTDKYKITYSYDLESTAANATLVRKITYDVEKIKNASVKQTTYKVTVSKLDETYKVGGNTYTLGNYVFNKSVLEDNTPAVDYYSGSTYIKRIFYINGTSKANSGKVTIETNSDTLVGYRHRWGSNETHIMNETISTEIPPTTADGTKKTWKANIQLKMSMLEKVRFEYIKTDPQNISFRGSYKQIRQQENVLQYTYDLPTVSDTAANDLLRVKGEKSIKKVAIVDNKALITPKFRDITGHWAESPIVLASSLELFNANASFFSPDSRVTRKDFFKALVRVVEDVKPLTEAELVKRTRGAGTPAPFPDISIKDPDISFYEFAKNSGMIIGLNEDFLPDKPITRAEMITAVINTLGIADMAPQPPYQTTFIDESSIPFWAKDGIYMANEIGLATGYSDGSIKPNQYVTRGEAAAMLTKLIDHMRETITSDYREKLINR